MKYEQADHKIRKIFNKSQIVNNKLSLIKKPNYFTSGNNLFKYFYIYETEWVTMYELFNTNYTNYEIELPTDIPDILLSTVDVKLIYKTTNAHTKTLENYIADKDDDTNGNYFSYLIEKKDNGKYYIIIFVKIYFYDDDNNTLPIELKFILSIYNPNTYYEIRANKT